MRAFVVWLVLSAALCALALPTDNGHSGTHKVQAEKSPGGGPVKAKRAPLMMPGMGGLGSMGGLGGGDLGGLGGGGSGGLGNLGGLGGMMGGGGMSNLVSMVNPSPGTSSAGAGSSPLTGLLGMGGTGGVGDMGAAGTFAQSLSGTPDSNAPSAASAGDCPPLYLVFARGTTEIQGTFGIVGRPLCSSLQKQIAGTLCYDVVYSSDAEYLVSPGAGANTASQFIAGIAAKCGSTKYALAGYSKGAMVVHQIHARNVVAAVTFGDPLKMQGVQSTNDFKTFCSAGDPVCENGAMMMAHLTYTMQDIPAAVQFIVQAFKSSGGATKGGATMARRKHHSRRKHASNRAGHKISIA